MSLARVEGAPALARWTARLALFSAVMLLFAILAHRFFGMATPVLLALVKLSFAGAALSLVLAVLAGGQIWRRGGPGAPRVLTAVIVSGAIFAWPVACYPAMRSLPEINDVTTSPDAPPAFQALVAARAKPANGTAYLADRFAALQKQHFPDIKPLMVNRSCEETFDLVADAVRRQKMQILREEPPDDANGRVGVIEAVDRTLVIGFRDDVVVRVNGNDDAARVDIRSASRYGRHDFGRNATRVRGLLQEIVGRLESTIPGAAENRRVRKRSRDADKEPEEAPSARKGADRKKEVPRR